LALNLELYDDMLIYLLTAIGLRPGGSNTVHIYTKTIHKESWLPHAISECHQELHLALLICFSQFLLIFFLITQMLITEVSPELANYISGMLRSQQKMDA
jgi:hypothetical protein